MDDDITIDPANQTFDRLNENLLLQSDATSCIHVIYHCQHESHDIGELTGDYRRVDTTYDMPGLIHQCILWRWHIWADEEVEMTECVDEIYSNLVTHVKYLLFK